MTLPPRAAATAPGSAQVPRARCPAVRQPEPSPTPPAPRSPHVPASAAGNKPLPRSGASDGSPSTSSRSCGTGWARLDSPLAFLGHSRGLPVAPPGSQASLTGHPSSGPWASNMQDGLGGCTEAREGGRGFDPTEEAHPSWPQPSPLSSSGGGPVRDSVSRATHRLLAGLAGRVTRQVPPRRLLRALIK